MGFRQKQYFFAYLQIVVSYGTELPIAGYEWQDFENHRHLWIGNFENHRHFCKINFEDSDKSITFAAVNQKVTHHDIQTQIV